MQLFAENALQWWQLSSCQSIMSLMPLHFAIPQYEYIVVRLLEFGSTASLAWLVEREALSCHWLRHAALNCERAQAMRKRMWTSQPTIRMNLLTILYSQLAGSLLLGRKPTVDLDLLHVTPFYHFLRGTNVLLSHVSTLVFILSVFHGGDITGGDIIKEVNE